MAVGFLRPAVIVPESLPDELAKPEMEHVLLHEAAHIARLDDWTNLIVRLLGAAEAERAEECMQELAHSTSAGGSVGAISRSAGSG